MAFQAQVISEEYTIFYDWHITVPWDWSQNGEDFDQSITWDETKTRLVSASFFGRIRTDDTNTGTNILMNDKVLIFGNFQFQAGQVEDTVDVTGLLRNGLNKFKIEIWKPIYFPTEIDAYFTGILTVNWEGEEPVIGPPSAPPPRWSQLFPRLYEIWQRWGR